MPTLRLKLLVTVLSGALMGAGAPLPFYVAYLDPPSAFNLSCREHHRHAADRGTT